jgi:hypothetical protein
MADEFLGDRRKALEDSFFADQNEKLVRELRQKHEQAARVEDLAAASGIQNPAVLEALAAVGVRGETLTALALVPLVAVAWADGEVQTGERFAILRAAHELGLERGNPSYTLLEAWLATRPGPDVVAAWKDYIAGLREHLDAVAYEGLERDVLGRAREVAAAAGGFLGLGNKVSESEEKVLAELRTSFS